jgi:hypothetical protein
MKELSYILHLSMRHRREGIYMINNGTIDTFYPEFRCPDKEKRHFGIAEDTVNYWGMLDGNENMFGIIMRPDCWIPNRFIMVINNEKNLKEWIGEWRGIVCHICGLQFGMENKEFRGMVTFLKKSIEDKRDFVAYSIGNTKTPKVISAYIEKVSEVFGGI